MYKNSLLQWSRSNNSLNMSFDSQRPTRNSLIGKLNKIEFKEIKRKDSYKEIEKDY